MNMIAATQHFITQNTNRLIETVYPKIDRKPKVRFPDRTIYKIYKQGKNIAIANDYECPIPSIPQDPTHWNTVPQEIIPENNPGPKATEHGSPEEKKEKNTQDPKKTSNPKPEDVISAKRVVYRNSYCINSPEK